MKRNNIKKICTYILVLLPILGTYGLFSKSITIADIFIVLALLLIFTDSIISHEFEISSKIFLFFSIWVLISTFFASMIISGVFSGITTNQIIKYILYSLAILLVPKKYFDFELAKKIYTRIVIVLCIIVFIQYIMYLITGSFYPWVINSKYLPATYVNDDYFTSAYLYMLGGSSFRPSSIFSEPALFAQYVAPCLVLNMFSKDEKKKYIILFIITLATFLGKSANGLIYISVIWFCYIVMKLYAGYKSKSFRIKTSAAFIILILIIIFPFFVSRIIDLLFGNDSSSLVNRLSEIGDVTGESSGSMRVIRGWQIYNGMSIFEKTNGIGIGNIINYLNMHPNIVKMFQQSYNGYMSGLSNIFVSFGFIGGFMFLFWWFKTYMIKNNLIKLLLIFLLLYLIASNSFLSSQFVLTIIMIIAIALNSKKNENN